MIKRFILLTTAVLGPTGRASYRDMVASVGQTRSAEHAWDIVVICLFQRASADARIAIEADLPKAVVPLYSDEAMGTAQARNVVLGCLSQHRAGFQDDEIIVGIPDDDVIFSPGFFTGLAALFDPSPDLDFVVVGSGDPPSGEPFPSSPEPLSTYQLVRRATSNTAYFRAGLLRRPRSFDTRLGPMTPTEGGEDSEFLFALARRSRRLGLVPGVYVRHRPETIQHTARYFMGSALALRSHLGWNATIKLVFLRKMMVGVYLVLTGRMPLGRLWRTMVRCVIWRSH